MSFFDDIQSGLNESVFTMGEPFTMGNHTGQFKGVFRGETSPVEFEGLQGYDTNTADALTVSKALFAAGDPPKVNEQITKANGTRWTITGIESGDSAAWDIELTQQDV